MRTGVSPAAPPQCTPRRRATTAIAAAGAALAAALALLAAPASAPAIYPNPTIAVTQTGDRTMAFTSNASGALGYDWDFGDGSAHSTAASPSHTYATANTYHVVLTVTYPPDPNDANAPTTVAGATDTHVYARPNASFIYSVLADGRVQFTDTSTGEPIKWQWTFPTGTYNGQSPPPQTMPGGTSPVTLKVSNPAGSRSATVQVSANSPPTASLVLTPRIVAVGTPVTLDAGGSTDPNHDALSYSWDLDGDMTYGDASGATQTKTYTGAGTYRVGVVVSDGHGGTSTAVDFVTVLNDVPPMVDFTTAPAHPVVGSPVKLTASASDPDGTVAALAWDLDDDGQFDDATGPVATATFATPGSRIVAVRATDDQGVTTIAFHTIDVAAPATQASSNPTTGAKPLRFLSPFPIVRIRGLIYKRSVHITLLSVRAPAGATVVVRCHGHSCPKHKRLTRHVRSGAVRFRALERRMRHGTVIEVFITATGQVGKYTRLTIVSDAAPRRHDLCLMPGRNKPAACPAQ